MKVVIKFKLPEEIVSYKIHNKASSMLFALEEIKEILIKEDNKTIDTEKFKKKFFDILEENHVNFDEFYG